MRCTRRCKRWASAFWYSTHGDFRVKPFISPTDKSVSMPQRLRPMASDMQALHFSRLSSHPQEAHEMLWAKHFSGDVSWLIKALKPVHWLPPASSNIRNPFITSTSTISFVAATMLFSCLFFRASSFCFASRTPAAFDFGAGLSPLLVAPKRVGAKRSSSVRIQPFFMQRDDNTRARAERVSSQPFPAL